MGEAFSGRWMVVRIAAAVGAILIIALMIVLLRGHGPGSGSPAAGRGALDSRTPALNQPAPNFALPDIHGQVVRLADLRGQVVLVNFWATWCIPCRQELPAIEQVYREQQGQGFTVLEVDEQEALSEVNAFTTQIGAMPPVLLDKNGSVMAQYHLKGLPDSFVLDRQGTVRAVSYGPLSRQGMLKDIDAARAASAP